MNNPETERELTALRRSTTKARLSEIITGKPKLPSAPAEGLKKKY